MTKEMGAASRLNPRPHLGVRKIGGSPLALRWAIGFVLVAACATRVWSAPPKEMNIRFSAVRVVDYFDQRELPVPSTAGLDELVGGQAAERAAAQISPLAGKKRPHRLLLRVAFTSTVHLQGIARSEVVVFIHTYFCNRPADFVVISGPRVYSDSDAKGLSDKVRPSDEPEEYYFFANVTRSESPLSKPPQRGFDLRTKPEDICFYLTVSGTTGLTYKSDVARVPVTEVEAAFRRE